MKIKYIYIYLLTAAFCGATFLRCEKVTTTVDCETCFSESDLLDTIEIKLLFSTSEVVDSIKYKVFQGKVNRGSVIFKGDSLIDEIELTVDIRHYYSLHTVYFYGDKKLEAIDGKSLDLDYITDYCSDPCYFFKDERVLDARVIEFP